MARVRRLVAGGLVVAALVLLAAVVGLPTLRARRTWSSATRR